MPLAGTSWVEIFPDAAARTVENSEAREYLGRLAEAGAKFAESIAPVSDRGSEQSPPGAYRDSFSSDIVDSGQPEAQVSNDDPIWHYLEYGTIHNRPFRVLSQTVQYMGDKTELT
jgi:hypothetical protein